MSRTKKPTAGMIQGRLLAVKQLVYATGEAMPTHAAELRRETNELIEDIMADVGKLGAAK